MALIKELYFSLMNYHSWSQEENRIGHRLEGSTPNVDVFLAVSPWNEISNTTFEIVKPNHDQILAMQLHHRHRNSFENFELWKHLRQGKTGSLSHHNDIINKSLIPTGKVPLWVQYDDNFSLFEVIEFITQHHIEEEQTVTIVNEDNIATDDMKWWCNADQEKRTLVSDKLHMTGIEDDIIIIVNSISNQLNLNEHLTRPRQAIIFITKIG